MLAEINQAIDEINNIQFSQKVCPTAMTPAEVNSFKDELSILKYDLIDLNQSLSYLVFARNNSPPRPIKDVLIQQYEQKKESLIAEIKSRQKCIFGFELNQHIQLISGQLGSGQHLDILRNLRSISTCLGANTTPPEITSNFQNMFSSIFNFFNNKLKREDLTPEECKTLQSTYGVWASFYDDLNSKNRTHAQQQNTIPLYNVNAHNSSYPFWLREQAEGRIAPQGIPLIHADTHTDMAHIHLYPRDQRFKQIPFNILNQILRASIRGDKTAILQRIRSLDSEINQPLNRQRLDPNLFQRIEPRFIQDLESWVTSTDIREIRSVLIEASKANIHEIAQPVTASVTSGLTSHLIMAMPPWSERLPRTTPSTPHQATLFVARSIKQKKKSSTQE